jgi:hypothetical protein
MQTRQISMRECEETWLAYKTSLIKLALTVLNMCAPYKQKRSEYLRQGGEQANHK